MSKEFRDQLDQQLEGHTSVAEVIKDLPLYEQILNRGQLMGKLMSRNLIEVVRRQAAEIQRLTKAESDEESSHSNTIDQRDHAESMADKLASAISKRLRVEIGEHSSMNCPWEVALDALNGAYVTDSEQDRELAKLKARATWLVREVACVRTFIGIAKTTYYVSWPDLGEEQSSRFASPEEAIDAAMEKNP